MVELPGMQSSIRYIGYLISGIIGFISGIITGIITYYLINILR
jgi:hypothetical protein